MEVKHRARQDSISNLPTSKEDDVDQERGFEAPPESQTPIADLKSDEDT